MTKHLRTDLTRLEKLLLNEGGCVEEAMRKAIYALQQRRADLARLVIDGDAEVDRREVEIEEECLKVLALHQPVATDLRFITACLKINNDLERVGDIAVNIAERALFLAGCPPIRIPRDLITMMEGATRMLREALDAFVNEDAAAARRICVEDDDVDNCHRAVFHGMLLVMQEHPDEIERAMQLVSVSRNLERLADHATNIAEDVIYMVEGEIIRHRARRK
jgi:phosphate transport system protein